MKKLITLVAAAAAFAGPALAGTITISFANDDGTTSEMAFDDSTMLANVIGTDVAFTYTYDDATATICGDLGEGEVCATFEAANAAPAVGDSSAYTLSTGGGGTATITALSE